MTDANVLDLRTMVLNGRLFRSPVDGNRIEAFIPPMGKENHAATMVETASGDLLCAWFAGSMEGQGDVGIALSRLGSGTDRWTAPAWASADPDRSEQNPVLFRTPGGELWLLYTAQETRSGTQEAWRRKVDAGEADGPYNMQWTSVIRRRISTDNGHTWSPVETFSGSPGSFCRQPMAVLSNGDWLFPMWYSVLESGDQPWSAHGGDHSVMRVSEDEGRTWSEHPVPRSRGRVHPCVIETAPGKLVAFLRSRSADWIYISRSTDYGRIWTGPDRTHLPNNNASIQAVRLASGNIAIVFNSAQSQNEDPVKTVWPPQRYPLTIALSEDDGRTWPYARHIDTGDDFGGYKNRHLNRRVAYPCIVQTRDANIHIAYSYRDRQCIKYVRVSEDWITEQQDVLWL